MNKKTEHTPTPWKVYYAKNNGQLVLGVGDADGQGIIACGGSFWGTEEEAKANSEHVVRCVNNHDELLEALECLLSKADREWGTNGDGIWPETRNDARAAIAKAKGETNE